MLSVADGLNVLVRDYWGGEKSLLGVKGCNLNRAGVTQW